MKRKLLARNHKLNSSKKFVSLLGLLFLLICKASSDRDVQSFPARKNPNVQQTTTPAPVASKNTEVPDIPDVEPTPKPPPEERTTPAPVTSTDTEVPEIPEIQPALRTPSKELEFPSQLASKDKKTPGFRIVQPTEKSLPDVEPTPKPPPEEITTPSPVTFTNTEVPDILDVEPTPKPPPVTSTDTEVPKIPEVQPTLRTPSKELEFPSQLASKDKKTPEFRNVQPTEKSPPDQIEPILTRAEEPRANVPPVSNHTIRGKNERDEDESHNDLICKDGLILRAWRPLTDISQEERILRGIIYFLAMVYLFIGVAIVSDRFMEGIEVITSSERRVNVLNKNGQRETITVHVWNETVANLTLMALGSSAPEILLSIIEMFQKNFEAGDLGPGTIVGSAAYNLFVIIGICIVVIPKGQVRRIQHFRVFVVTASWSVFAYVWMCIITKYVTPNVIDIWEALVTLISFPVFVYHSYITERRLFCPRCYKNDANQRGVAMSSIESPDRESEPIRSSIKDLIETPEMREFEEQRREYITKLKELYRRYPQYDLEKIQAMAQEHLIRESTKSRAFYRVHSGRRLTGAGGVLRKARDYAAVEIGQAKAVYRMQVEEEEPDIDDEIETRLYFEPGHYTVLESVGDVELHVIRAGSLANFTKVEYYTEDGTAEAGSDYIPVSGVLEFPPGIEEQIIKITIVDDDVFEEDEHFYVHLRKPSDDAVIITPKVATVMILDDDHCGIFEFKEKEHIIPENVGIYEVKVKRYSGVRCKIVLPYYTKAKTATSGKEYMDVKGELIFDNGVYELSIEIEIIEEHSFEKNVTFEVHLGQPRVSEDDALLLRIREVQQKSDDERTFRDNILLAGLPKLAETTKILCHIVESEEFKQTVNKLVQTANASKLIGTTSWKEQFLDAMTVSGGGGLDVEDADDDIEYEEDEDDDDTGPSGCEYFMHFLSIFWKICFSIIPPAKICSGYPCFFISIILIAICTAVLTDVSSHFGCTLGVLDSVTAICLVALGTSLPDTFASKVAAIHDKTADNAIGNVTGSNAVNVFLGIGIAWSMAAIYHAMHGSIFYVPVGSLLFSTVLYLCEAVIGFAIIVYRRKPSIGGELGGPVGIKWFHGIILFALWFIYLAISTMEAYGIISGF
ncbi:sodium/calcium exchanger 3-like [Bactrocera tryoni]|uniref:sodium/calcium exchanger 3-like n=1 Tax=Bactrocera tryoni TaxID=59916 RepID=UPI001A957900|nr:sodium/calcium exchanger 3-like [Bactrocera tryoni]